MAQTSGPISQSATASDRQMTDVMWRDLFGGESGIVGDPNGVAYFFNRTPDTDIAQIGAVQNDSIAIVGGFFHKIPVGQTEPITIPAATGTARTDIIALRYDPAYTGQPGPVRLVRIAGTSASLPVLDTTRPGVEELPLWAVTRQPGQTLMQATLVRMAPWINRTLVLNPDAQLPLSPSMGTLARRGSEKYLRTLDGNGLPVWVLDSIATNAAPLGLLSGIGNGAGSVKPVTYWREEKTAYVVGTITLTAPLAGLATKAVADVPAGFRPTAIVTAATNFDGRFEITSGGRINLLNGRLQEIPKDVPLPLHLIIPLG